MKILVAVKRVVSLDDDFELDDGAVESDYLEDDLNEWDRVSLQAALELTVEGDGEIVVATIDGEAGDEQLRGCLALGAHRAIRVEQQPATRDDPLATARLIAGLIRREAPDLVLCGVQASDTVNGATGVAAAALAGYTRAAVVRRVELAHQTLTADRELEGGLVERISVPLPALLTIQSGHYQPGYANLRALKQAKALPVEVLDPAELDLGDTEIRAVREASLVETPTGTRAEMIDGRADEIAGRIIALVREGSSG